MKKNYFAGTMLACLGMICACGTSIVCGLMAVVCMGAALCAFRYESKSILTEAKQTKLQKAA